MIARVLSSDRGVHEAGACQNHGTRRGPAMALVQSRAVSMKIGRLPVLGLERSFLFGRDWLCTAEAPAM